MSKGAELLAKYEDEVEAIWQEMTPKSRALAERAEEFIPGGALRSHSTGTYPSYGERVDGCYMYDVDGNRSIDLALGMTQIIGHNHPKVAEALHAQIPNGLVSFMPEEAKDNLAEMMCKRVPSVEKVWYTLGGSQAFMWSIRAARAFTGRDKVLKIRGGYNGTYDDAIASLPTPERPNGTPGLTANSMENILFFNWNDKEGTEKVIRENHNDIAALLTEGFFSGGTIAPHDGFLKFLRDQCDKYGIILIFDEIVNFWLDHGGTGAIYDVKPDLNCYGKGIGGGLPMGLIGGRNDIMALFSQANPSRVAAIVAHQGDPMSVAASTACLNIMTKDEITRINTMGELLADGLRTVMKDVGIRGHVVGYGNHQSVHFTTGNMITDPATYSRNNHQAGLRDVMPLFRRSLINKGVRTLENLQALRVSTPVTEVEIDAALAAIKEGFEEIHPILKEVAPDLVS